jgi:HK97 family phage major capsid protein
MSHKDQLLKTLAGIRAKEISMEDVEKELKEFQEAEGKADEVMHTGNVGAGAELIEAERLSKQILDMVPNYSSLLPLLPGDHGMDLNITEKLPIVGELPLFRGNSEWKDAPAPMADGTKGDRLATDSVTIVQGMFYLEVPISKRELNYAITDLFKLVTEKIQKSAGRTIDAVILNGDTDLTGNVNRDGFDFGTLTPEQREAYYYLQIANGIRKLGIANGTAIGALDEDDLLDLTENIGEYANADEDLLYITSNNVRNKIRKFDSYKDASKSGSGSSVHGKKVEQIWGIDLVTARDNPSLSASNGKVHDTTGNIAGQIQLVWKPAVQYGFGQSMDFETRVVPGKGIILVTTFEFGFAIVNAKAGQPNTVTTGYNITL